MGHSFRRTAIVLSIVGTLAIAWGVVSAVYGVPAAYGMTTAQALDVLDQRPLTSTTVWVVWATAMMFAALWRANWLAQHEPEVRFTAVRGSIWLWGSIGAPWIYVWMAWDIQLFDFFEESPPEAPVSAASMIGPVGLLGALLALVTGVVWSSVIGSSKARKSADDPDDDSLRPAGVPGSQG